MMKKGKFKSIAAMLFILLMLVSNFSAAYAASSYQSSSWASKQINICTDAGLIPEDFDTQPFTESITREDFCELLINTCRILEIPLPELPTVHPFTDTEDINVEYAYFLGLTKGTSEFTFSPEMTLTREMAAVMLSRMLMLFQSTSGNEGENTIYTTEAGTLAYVQPMSDEKANQILEEYSVDYYNVSPWAKTNLANVFTRGILSGVGGGKLDPKNNTTREQAAMLSLNVLTYFDESKVRAAGVEECVLPKPTGIYISPYYKAGNVLLRWNDIPSASAYDVTIIKNGVPSYTKRIITNFLDLRPDLSSYSQTSSLYNSIFGNDKESIQAAIKVTPVNSSGEPSIFSMQQEFSISPLLSINEIITGDPNKNQFANIYEAELNMTSVTVKVWNLTAAGEKISATRTFSINKNIAEDVKKIFEEIYNGDEKFPIKSIIGYSYRDGTSQHSNGTAIDINPEENYFVSLDGVIKSGKLWQPGVNPYSILPDGDVALAFNNYGWRWSPDMNWRNGKDYMHFSLSGK